MPSDKVRSAAYVLLDHIVSYNMAERHGEDFVDKFIDELSLIHKGKVEHGRLLELGEQGG